MQLTKEHKQRVRVFCKKCGAENISFAVCNMFICSICGAKNRLTPVVPPDARVVAPPRGEVIPV